MIEELKGRVKFLSPPSKHINSDAFYHEFATVNYFWIKWRFEVLKNLLPRDYAWGKTLDIGCGIGIIQEQIEKHYGIRIFGCDLNIQALSTAALKSNNLYFYDIHQRNEEFKEGFSTIILLDVLEHIEKPAAFLGSVNYHLNQGGRIIINVPAIKLLYSKYDIVSGHVKRYTIAELKEELSLAGFHIEAVTYWCMSLMPVLLLRKFMLYFCRNARNIKKIGSQPNSPAVDMVLQSLRRLECKVFPRPPIGVSFMVIARKG